MTSLSDSRIFLECPDHVDGIDFGDVSQIHSERTIVTSDFFGDALPFGRILTQHNIYIRETKTPVSPILGLGQVAGYRHALFGLPEQLTPILFFHPQNPNVLIATIRLSDACTSRFCPGTDWQIVLGRIQAWLQGNDSIAPIAWDPPVHPSYAAGLPLPSEAGRTAFDRCANWFMDNMFYDHTIGIGVFEGYASGIAPKGRQSLRPRMRGDCSGEATMVTALDWAINRNHAARHTTRGILENLFHAPELIDSDPNSHTYGGVNFYENIPAYYSDDNCRAFMGAILAQELTGDTEYMDHILRGMAMILRSCGKNGFRRSRLDSPDSFTDGQTWKTYHDEDFVLISPHRQAYMWAGFIQAYALTGYQEFLDKAIIGIRLTMRQFPRLQWTNGITQEYARMILPLAMLVEVNDTMEHREWLQTAVDKLMEYWIPCGTIRESMGDPTDGLYPAPASNEAYGTSEAPLIQENGDPCSDLLYTVNFAFIGLYEAAQATGDPTYRKAYAQMADFLIRIQVSSEAQPYLDGCWLRGFDYELWDFYGSSADTGWGAWSVESGWTNSWIAATFGLAVLGRPLLCRKNQPLYRQHFTHILQDMSEVRVLTAYQRPRATAPGAE